MAEIDPNELQIFNEDNFCDDEAHFNGGNNEKKVYGRDIPGSFGKFLHAADLCNPKILLFTSHHAIVNTLDLIAKLVDSYQLNFISMATKKIKSNPKATFLLIHYHDEVQRFLNRIKEGDRYVMSVNNTRVSVVILENYKFGLAGLSNRFNNDRNMVYNLHFGFSSDISISPSRN